MVNNYDKLVEAEKSLASLKLTVQQVIDLIDEIGEVDIDSEKAIIKARVAYDNLTEDLKPFVNNYSKLVEAEKLFSILKSAVKPVIDLIEAIGEVDIDSEKAITKARVAYDNLTEDLKPFVNNYSKLVEAEKRLSTLKLTVQQVIELIDAIGEVDIDSERAITKARSAYDELTDNLKKLVNNYSKLVEAEKRFSILKSTVQPVIDLINAIGEVNSDSGEAITIARKAYDGLAEDLKEMVANYDKLTQAEKTYAPLEEVAPVLDEIPEVNTDNVEEATLSIQAALEAYNSLTEEQRSKVTNSSKLFEAMEKVAEINHSVEIDDVKLTAGGIDWNIKVVTEDASPKAKEELAKEVGDKNFLILYDIHLLDTLSGKSTQVGENGITLTFTLDNLEGYENFKVLHLADGNILEVLTPVVDGNTLTVTLKSLSPVAIVANTIEEKDEKKEELVDTGNKDDKDGGDKKDNSKGEDNVKTGDSFSPVTSISLIIASALGIVILTLKKKQTIEN